MGGVARGALTAMAAAPPTGASGSPEASPSGREQLLRDGYVICRDVIPKDWLARMRRQYEVLIDQYYGPSASLERQRQWRTGSAPRLHLSYAEDEDGSGDGCGSLVRPETAACVEWWTHPRFHGLSSSLLGVEDAACADMLLMCNGGPEAEPMPGLWHRDFFPPRCAPLASYEADIEESGPRYIQVQPPPTLGMGLDTSRCHRCLLTAVPARRLALAPRAVESSALR